MLIREELREYTRRLMREAHERGAPVIRPCFYEFPHDPASWEIEQQYMYGDKYLCCPVLEQGQRKMKVYLPPLTKGYGSPSPAAMYTAADWKSRLTVRLIQCLCSPERDLEDQTPTSVDEPA